MAIRTHCRKGHQLTPDNRDYMGRCRTCANARSRKHYRENTEIHRAATEDWKKRNPDKYKNAVLKSVHGLTLEQFNERLEKQGNRCLICRREFSKTLRPYIDHSHESGKTRGILCQQCNTLLGFAKDKIEILLAAIEYLKMWS